MEQSDLQMTALTFDGLLPYLGGLIEDGQAHNGELVIRCDAENVIEVLSKRMS